MVPITRVELAISAAGNWVDVDVTAHLGGDAGDVAGVMLEIVNNSGTEHTLGLRRNGSGDTVEGAIFTTTHTWIAIGIDANDIFECKISNTTDIDVFLIGYIKNSEGSFLTNAIEKVLTLLSTWEDINISADTGEETAVCAFWLIRNTSTSANYGLRKNGSTDNRYRKIAAASDLHGAMMSVDESEICEGFTANYNTIDFFLIGWLTDNFSDWANAKNYQTAVTAAWALVDMSGDIPSGWDGAFMHFHPTSDSLYDGGIRKMGTGYDNYYDLLYQSYFWVAIDSNRQAQQKISSTSLDLYLWGYTKQPLPANNAPTAPTSLQVDGQSSPTGANCISDLTPGFTAIYNDPDAGDQSNAIQIQVGTASGLSDMWDSGWLADSTVTPNRCTAKTYAGAALSAGTSYWWRCRFRDDENAEGAWSEWQQFDMCAALNLVQMSLV